MKKIFTLLVLSAFATGMFGQMETTIDFEEGLADTAWIVFANGPSGSDADIDVVPNPYPNQVNSSDSVLSFLVRDSADRWVGMYVDVEDYAAAFTEFTEEAHTLAMMVYKDVISPCALKVERSLNSFPDGVWSVYNSNTVTDEWELITFDFSGAIGYYFQRLTMFPHFPETDEGKLWEDLYVYIDNIGVPSEDNTSVKEVEGETMWLYPTPAEFRMAVQYPGMSGITISDIMGRQIRTMKFAVTDSKVIETGDLKTGIYFLTAETADGKVTMRFLKK